MQVEILYYVQIFVSNRWDNYSAPYQRETEMLERYHEIVKHYPMMKWRPIKKTTVIEPLEAKNE